MNVNRPGAARRARLVNHLALALSFGSMFTDTLKMVFVADYYEAGTTESESVEDFSN